MSAIQILIFALVIAYISRMMLGAVFAAKIKRVSKGDYETLDVRLGVFPSSISVTQYLSSGKHKKFDDEGISRLGSFLDSFYRRFWMIKAFLPLAAGVFLLFTLFAHGNKI